MAALFKIWSDIRDGIIVYRLPMREKQEFIEEIECGSGWLVNACYNEQLHDVSRS